MAARQALQPRRAERGGARRVLQLACRDGRALPQAANGRWRRAGAGADVRRVLRTVTRRERLQKKRVASPWAPWPPLLRLTSKISGAPIQVSPATDHRCLPAERGTDWKSNTAPRPRTPSAASVLLLRGPFLEPLAQNASSAASHTHRRPAAESSRDEARCAARSSRASMRSIFAAAAWYTSASADPPAASAGRRWSMPCSGASPARCR